MLATMASSVLGACRNSNGVSASGAIPVAGPVNDAFLDTLEHRTFDYFWQSTNARNGLAPDRWPDPPFASIAAVGFALTAYPIGVERKWVTREEAAARTLTTLRFFWSLPQGDAKSGIGGKDGFFYHFLDMESGARFKDVELSNIDTALLLAGALFAGEYFTGATNDEVAIRAYADSLYRRVNWPTFVQRPPLMSMGWAPEGGFNTYDWKGLNEAMLMYVLAIGSPTHPIDARAWEQYTSTYTWGAFYGFEMANFAPLFGHQYSEIWIDPHGLTDAAMRAHNLDYFENGRRATLSQRAYATANPDGWVGYGPNVWGLTACDGPMDTTVTYRGAARKIMSYAARGAALDVVRDDGTLAPTAAGGSIVYTPDLSATALEAMRSRWPDTYTRYGFLDAFNPTLPTLGLTPKYGKLFPNEAWIDTQYLGIDQGPIIAMIENYRSGLVWRLMKKNPHVLRGLQRAGFEAGWIR